MRAGSVRHALGAAVVALLSASVLAACIAPVDASPTEVVAMPDFTGPFAAEYEEAWHKSESSVARAVLEDGLIADQEWSEVLADLTDCLTEQGITLVEYRPDGSYEVSVGDMDGDLANERMGGCERYSGEPWIGRLYRAQTDNPENIPDTQLLTECLIRNHAVPEDYTVEQYLEDAPDLAFPYLDEHGPDTFAGCNADPDYEH